MHILKIILPGFVKDFYGIFVSQVVNRPLSLFQIVSNYLGGGIIIIPQGYKSDNKKKGYDYIAFECRPFAFIHRKNLKGFNTDRTTFHHETFLSRDNLYVFTDEIAF
ncbi:MAG: hypothetical protein DRP87_13485 [Spirochaetes bacterium]|nr:MAG: hypothetical protein DRP87_13485 [Spirochaetota bacterium]